MNPPDEILAEVQGRLGIITLNRPKALNALTLVMSERLDTILADWSTDPAVDAVLIRGNSRAFCAGGDVRAIGSSPDPAERERLGAAFFRVEYRLNHRIHTFPKPFVALASGVVMGGGMGLAIHGTIRVVTETTLMAMPETVLGLFPDVGATWFLDRCPGRVGMYLGLTGARLGAADAIWSGLATDFIPAERLDAFVAALAARGALERAVIDATIEAFSATPPAAVLAERATTIDRLFGGDRLEDVLTALEREPGDGWIAEALAVLRRASPLSLRATWRRLQAGRGQSIEAILVDDFRMGVRLVAGHDFAEGVRAILIDKDNAPRWAPADLARIDEARIDALLAPMLSQSGDRDPELAF